MLYIFFFYYFEYWIVGISEARSSNIATQDRINAITNLQSNKLWQNQNKSLKIILDTSVVAVIDNERLKKFSVIDGTVKGVDGHDDINKFLFENSKVIIHCI